MATTYRYPANVGSPPFDKWIRFDAKALRHVLRKDPAVEKDGQDANLATVVLYLTESVLKSTLAVTWDQQNLGGIAGPLIAAAAANRPAFMSMVDAVKTGISTGEGGDVLASLQKAVTNVDITALAKGALSAFAGDLLKAVPDSALTAAAVLGGIKTNPRTEVLFDTQQYRGYNLDFLLIPRTKEEGETIHQIVRFFQFYMLPKYELNDTVIGYPFEFEVGIYASPQNPLDPEIKSANQIKRIAQIGRCIVKNVTVDHAGGGKVAFVSDGELYPAVTQLSLELQEVKLLDRTDEEILRGEAPFPEE